MGNGALFGDERIAQICLAFAAAALSAGCATHPMVPWIELSPR
jgi:hypothetical protein